MDTQDSPPALPFGTRVEIGGRTMLRAGFSLVGLTGMIYLPSPNIPAGCSTVAVDWNAHGYTPEKGYPVDSLPPLVNVPTLHLTLLDEDGAPLAPPEKPKAAAPKEPPAPTPLRKLAAPEAAAPKDESPTDEPGPDDEGPAERPKLRLV